MPALPDTLPDLGTWLTARALPLWRGTGIDAATGTSWEALDMGGAPLPALPRRLRVQARQAYCFARLGEVAQARQLLAFVLGPGTVPPGDLAEGRLVAWFEPDLSVREALHDLYDLSFVMLAVAALAGAGEEMGAEAALVERALARLKAPRGWRETADSRLPRRQNPHMHLFEASTALYRATGLPWARAVADECLGLFSEVFYRDGLVLEFFDAEFAPVAEDAQSVEPGHMIEWVALIDAWEDAMGQGAGHDLPALFAAGWALRDRGDFLPDHVALDVARLGEPVTLPPAPAAGRRMWPQTELLRAASLLARRKGGGALPDAATPDAVLARFWGAYIAPAPAGGWVDRVTEAGEVVSDTVPASSFYHVLGAFEAYMGGLHPHI